MLNQQFLDPFLAVVIDPTRNVSAGKVDKGAFQTYPQGYEPPDEPPSEYQDITINKIEDFGVHCKQYDTRDVTYLKSSLDSRLFNLLWNDYWMNTLFTSLFLGTYDYVARQVSNIAEKLKEAESHVSGHDEGMCPQRNMGEDSELATITRDNSA